MKDIDRALRRLAEEKAPLRLSMVDAAVLEQIEGHRFGERDVPTPFGAVVAVALVVGIAAGFIPGHTSHANDTFAEISGAAKLAPSTLLVDAS